MYDALHCQVLVQSEITADLLPVNLWRHQRAAPDRRETIQEGDYLLVLPDDVVRCQCRIALDKTTDETALGYFLQVACLVECDPVRLLEYTRSANASATMCISRSSIRLSRP